MRSIGAIALLLALGGSIRGQGVEIRQIFGPKDAGGLYKHPASITQLDNGDLYLTFYGGSGEYATDTAVYGSRLKAGTDKWTKPVVVADTPFVSEGNPVVWQSPDELVWLFYVVRYGKTWSTSRIQAKISRDGAQTWSDPIILAFEPGMMVRNRPMVLKNGDYLLPIYHETGDNTEIVGPDSTSLFLRYDLSKKEWSESSRIRSPNGNIQPAVAAIGDDHLLAFCRRGGGYGPNTKGYIIRSESRDGGRTWSDGKDTTFPNPNAAVDLLRLKSGNLLLIYNDSMFKRDPLAAALSTDGGKTFPHRINIVEGGTRDFAYPYVIQTKDDKIHLIFTSHKRTVINHAVFDESVFRQGSKEDSAKAELEKLAGAWSLVSELDDGKEMPAADARKTKLFFYVDCRWKVEFDGKIVGQGTLTIDPRKQLKTIDYTFIKGETPDTRFTAIYELEGDTFKHCGVLKGDRPMEFSAKAGSGRSLTVFQRDKK